METDAGAGSLAVGRMEEVSGLESEMVHQVHVEKNLMDMPEELFDYIFSELSLNDLLRLRRVSKQLKPLVEDYLRLHVNSEKFFRVNLSAVEDEALSALLAFDFVAPFSKFSIGHVKDEMWRKWGIQEFLEVYGTRITHLKIDSLEIPIVSTRKIIRFFESLPNLQYLEILNLFERQGHQSRKKRSHRGTRDQLIPSTFKCLRTLLINEYDCGTSLESVGLIWQFVEGCSTQLVTSRHPLIRYRWGFGMDLGDLPGGRFGCVRRILEGPNHLKSYDLQNVDDDDDDGSTIPDFYELVTVCAIHDVKLLHVGADLIEAMIKLETRDKEEHGRKLSSVVVSLDHIHKSSFLLKLPYLEEIDIICFGTSRCSMPNPDDLQRKAWPHLKNLGIAVDSDYLHDVDEGLESNISVSALLDYFFVGITREKMESLELAFYEDISQPLPRMINVCRSCPNLKELILYNWPGSNQEIAKLWTNLPVLEKVTFDKCRDLGIGAFVGDDRENPEFLQTNNLRSLTLAELKRMPQITDQLFTQVLRHKPLRELHLQSDQTISHRQLTMAGLTSLLDGALSETIERLSLEIRMERVTTEELKELGKRFRSWNML